MSETQATPARWAARLLMGAVLLVASPGVADSGTTLVFVNPANQADTGVRPRFDDVCGAP